MWAASAREDCTRAKTRMHLLAPQDSLTCRCEDVRSRVMPVIFSDVADERSSLVVVSAVTIRRCGVLLVC